MSSNANVAKSGDVVGRKSVENSRPTVATEKSSFSTLDYYLYGKNVVSAIDMQNIQRQSSPENSGRERNNNASSVCLNQNEGKCTTHAPLQSLRQLVHAEDHGIHEGGSIKATYAVLSFPDEVQLCTSSIPGAVYGVCARRHLPSGTWIGPYEGRRTVDQRYDASENRDYMWEIYTEGNFSHFIDGSDENSSSWMRFIRCARNKKEQNMAAYQCGQNIYYRSFRDIAMGEELLVWYSDSYLKHLEIPLCLQEMDQAKIEEVIGKTNDEELEVNVTALNPRATDSVSFLCTRSRPLPTETAVSHSNPEQHIIAQHRTEETAQPHSSRSLEQAPPTVQQALANQIKKRIEKEKYIPSEELAKKDPQEGLKNYELRQAETSDFQDFNSGSFVIQEGYKTTVANDLSLPFKCRQCSKVFTQRIQLQMHVCPKSPYKPFQCGHCSLSFAQPSELRNHVVIHSSERPFKCGYCGRSFAGATTLNNHVRTHTGEKPFVCKSCGKTFAIATQLARHMRVSGDCPGNASSTDRSKYASEGLVEYD